MGRVLDIINDARDTLADKSSQKFSNSRLLRLLSECQIKIARETLCLRYQGTIQLCDKYHTYKLDPTLIEPLGGTPLALHNVVNHAGKDCKFVTNKTIARIDETWRTKIGSDVTHIVYDHRKPLEFRVYPIPDATELTDSAESFNTSNEPLTDAATISEAISVRSNFDITAEKSPIKIMVEFYHITPKITTVQDTNLLIPEHFDIAMKYYVVGMALRDDKDSQNRSFGLEELKFYQEQFQIAKAISESGYVDNRSQTYAAVDYQDVTVE